MILLLEKNMAKQKVTISEEINTIVGTVQKECGGESMRRGIVSGKIEAWPVIPTRSISLDIALGIGGYPKGRIVEIYGPESSGKTTLASIAVAESQKKGEIAAYIDAEHAIDPAYTANLGVNLDDLLFSQPDTSEEALNIVEQLLKLNKLGIIVVDSVASMVPRAELEGEMGDQFIGLQARLMGQALRKLKGQLSKCNTCLIFINQIREKIGSMPGTSPEVTPGGKALKFYSSVRLDIRRIGPIQDKTGKIGNETKVKVVKNKLAPPFKEAIFPIIYGKGIDPILNLLDVATKAGIILLAGSQYSYSGKRLGTAGKAGAVDFLNKLPEMAIEIDALTRKKLISEIVVVNEKIENEDSEDIEATDSKEAEAS